MTPRITYIAHEASPAWAIEKRISFYKIHGSPSLKVLHAYYFIAIKPVDIPSPVTQII